MKPLQLSSEVFRANLQDSCLLFLHMVRLQNLESTGEKTTLKMSSQPVWNQVQADAKIKSLLNHRNLLNKEKRTGKRKDKLICHLCGATWYSMFQEASVNGGVIIPRATPLEKKSSAQPLKRGVLREVSCYIYNSPSLS